MTGARIAHYEILEKLGEGSMGVVYKARDLRLDRLVALKVLAHGRAADPEFERMFAQEAKAASALNHPNIVTIYGVERADGSVAIAMEYVGRTLEELIGQRGLPVGQALKYAIQIADGLSAAHAAGVIHRDLKPRNIAITEKEQVKILDFGLAKLTRAAAVATSATQTIETRIAGTPAYMSPEQAEGKDVDVRADVFSFGVVLYEMITGRQPFLRDTQTSTLAALLRDDPAPPEGVSPELARFIERCLRKDPERRIRHLDDAKLILEDLRSDYESMRPPQDQPPSSRPRPRRRRLGPVLAAASAAIIAAGAFVAWLVPGHRTPPAPASAPIPLTSYLGNEVQPSFSPDGNQIAFVWDGERQDNADIYVKLIGGSDSPLRLTADPAQDLSPAWSPDGRFIAFVRNNAIAGKASVLVVPAIGGPERLVCDLGTSLATPVRYMVVAPFPLLAWTPDGKFLIVVDRSSRREPLGLFVVSFETGEKRRLTSAPDGYVGDGAPAVRSDGRAVIFSRAAGLTASELFRLELTEDLRPAGKPWQLTFTKRWNSGPVWLSDGREFMFSTSDWYLASGSLRRMPAAGGLSPAAVGGIGDDVAWLAVSPRTHRLVFSRSLSTQNIWRLPIKNGRAAGQPEKLIASTRMDEAPQYSPDGKRIAFASSRSGSPEIWVCERDGANALQLTSLGGPVTGSPHWSPDGERIVFDSNHEGQFGVYLINASGGNPRRLTTHQANDALASFSRDNVNIYFSSERTGRWEVWKMPVAGGNPTQVTTGGGRAPIESPDGRLLYYEKSYGLWSMPVSGGQETKLLDSVGFLNFAVAQKGIYFIGEEDVDPRRTIQFLDLRNRNIVPVFENGNPVGAGFAVAPDDSSLLFTDVVQRGSDLMLVERFE